jgi:hypothetical protein
LEQAGEGIIAERRRCMDKSERIEILKQEARELTKQGRILEAVTQFNEAWELQFGETKPKIRPEIMAFAEAMEAEMARHDEEKGDSWKAMPKDDLLDMLGDCFENWWNEYNEGYETEGHDYIAIANYAMMIWHKAKGD